MHRKRLLQYVLSVFLLILPLPLVAGGDWQKEQVDVEKDIVVYTRSVKDSSYKECRGETMLTTSLGALVNLIADTDSFPEWMHNVKSAKVLKQISSTERLTYTAQDTPWPISDRDTVVYSRLYQDPETKQITIEMQARPDAYPEQEGYVRIPVMKSKWELTPKADQSVEVVYQLLADPGGRLPARVANAYAAKMPLNSLRGLHRMIEKPQYRDVRMDIISEP